jgi:benzoate membrane transport protein
MQLSSSWSAIAAGMLACLVGFGGAVPVVLAGAAAVGASEAQTASWISGLCLAIAVSTGWLSWRHKMPVVTAWSTPGAAVIAATSGIAMEAAVGAFVTVAVLIILTSLIEPLARLIGRLPVPIAAAMLAGVLFRFVADVALAVPLSPLLVLTMVATFLVVRLHHPMAAILAALAVGVGVTVLTGNAEWSRIAVTAPSLVLTAPTFDVSVQLGLALPLFLVTMAAQNLPGLAVLRGHGYAPPVRPILAVTGAVSLLTAPFGAHTLNLAAISAAICTGPDCHPDPARRWIAGMSNAASYAVIAVLGGSVVALFAALPKALIACVAGLALTGAFVSALSAALSEDRARFAAICAFATTASGLTLVGVGAPFWGLSVGLVVLMLDRYKSAVQ